MSFSRAFPLCLLVLLGCTREEVNPLPTEAQPAAEQPTAGATDAGYVVRLEVLDRFLQYQDRALALQLKTVAGIEALEARDAGTGPEAISLVREEAKALGKLRSELKLSEGEVLLLEQITGDVISRRALAATSEEEASLRELEVLAANLSDADRAKMEASLASVREEQKTLESLAAERARYGEDNVDAVLARERELTRQWHRTLTAFAGRDGGAP